LDVQEIRKLDDYLKRLFGNARIRVVLQNGDMAKVFVGEDNIGELSADEDEGERSFNLRMEIPLGETTDLPDAKRLEAALRRKFDNERIRVVARPKKQDSVEAYLGEEFIGVLFVDDKQGRRLYIFEMPILDIDLEPSRSI
jgi:hypothetical protein